MTRKKPTGYVIYDGPSLADGKPIVVIATVKSGNSKTGNMIQTYIIRKDIDPRLANKTGEDFSICGYCPHKGEAMTPAHPDYGKYTLAKNRTCYVRIDQGVLIVYKAFHRGIYPIAYGHNAIAAIGAGRVVRLGTYGDPAIVPSWVWESLLSLADSWTGYSHQSGLANADFRPDLTMHSADSLDDAKLAWSKGNRTFRIVANVKDIVKGKETLCPASEEAGRRTTCDKCKLCKGNSIAAKSIAIPAHGNGAKNFAAQHHTQGRHGICYAFLKTPNYHHGGGVDIWGGSAYLLGKKGDT